MNQFFEHQENLVLFRHFLAICKNYFFALHNLANPQEAGSPDLRPQIKDKASLQGIKTFDTFAKEEQKQA